MKKQSASAGILLFAAALWGASYVIQKIGGAYIGPFTLNSLRGLIGAAVLVPLLLIRWHKSPLSPETVRKALCTGLAAGLILSAATILQQLGIMYTTVGKAGFITSLHIVIVPVLGLFFGKRGSWLLWTGVGLTFAGLYLLCFQGSTDLTMGDLITFLGAVFFSIHMMYLERHARNVDGVLFSAVQFLVCGILCAFPMLLSEKPTAADLGAAWLPIIYAGAVSFGLGSTLQLYVQRHLSAASTALIMSTEAVFSAVFGWLILHEALSGAEIAGCLLILSATLLIQSPALLEGIRKKRSKV